MSIVVSFYLGSCLLIFVKAYDKIKVTKTRGKNYVLLINQ